jgi:2-dehydropantoate 2-reductase
MKITIVGAGSIGGFVGARLALAGQHEVHAFARGETLLNLQTKGWRLTEADGLETRSVACLATQDASTLGVQDLVVLAVKAPALVNVLQQIKPLLGPQTTLMAAMNGLPWWFMSGVEAIDPRGQISSLLAPQQAIGCVVHMSSFCPEPGWVRVKMLNTFILGAAPTNTKTAGLENTVAAFKGANIPVTRSPDVRADIWYKLWGNMTLNPISALTGATGDQVLDQPQLRELCTQCMLEAQRIGAKIGCPIAQTPEDRHQVTRQLGAFKTSMLQDVEQSRPIELDALVGSVRDIGRLVGEPTPFLDALYGMTWLFARNKQLI